MTIKFENGGNDAPIVENKIGGKQSVPIGDFTLLPTYFAKQYVYEAARKQRLEPIGRAYGKLVDFLEDLDIDLLDEAMDSLSNEPLTAIARVMEEGLKKYPKNNWLLISYEDHINHALCHLYMHIKGDEQDEHLEHALTRIAMAYETFLREE